MRSMGMVMAGGSRAAPRYGRGAQARNRGTALDPPRVGASLRAQAGLPSKGIYCDPERSQGTLGSPLTSILSLDGGEEEMHHGRYTSYVARILARTGRRAPVVGSESSVACRCQMPVAFAVLRIACLSRFEDVELHAVRQETLYAPLTLAPTTCLSVHVLRGGADAPMTQRDHAGLVQWLVDGRPS